MIEHEHTGDKVFLAVIWLRDGIRYSKKTEKRNR